MYYLAYSNILQLVSWGFVCYLLQKKFNAVCVSFPDRGQKYSDAVFVAGIHVRTFRHLKMQKIKTAHFSS